MLSWVSYTRKRQHSNLQSEMNSASFYPEWVIFAVTARWFIAGLVRGVLTSSRFPSLAWGPSALRLEIDYKSAIKEFHNWELETRISTKDWKNTIMNIPDKPRMKAVAMFRLTTGHGILAIDIGFESCHPQTVHYATDRRRWTKLTSKPVRGYSNLLRSSYLGKIED